MQRLMVLWTRLGSIRNDSLRIHIILLLRKGRYFDFHRYVNIAEHCIFEVQALIFLSVVIRFYVILVLSFLILLSMLGVTLSYAIICTLGVHILRNNMSLKRYFGGFW
jgi:hypothetical protein